jgi:tetratricopeptide repeat protein
MKIECSTAISQCRFPNRQTYLGRRTGNRRSLMAALCLLTLVASSVMAQTDTSFFRANDEYAKGKFQDAIRDYGSLVQAKQWSAPLFYDLGNAYFRTGDLGRSILNYERALALDPQHPESAANLALAREEARSLELQRGRFDVLLRRITPDQVTIVAAVAFWIAVIGLTATLLLRRRSTMSMLATVVALIVTVLSVFLVYQLESTRKTLAIITGPDVQARLATADNAGTVLHLPPGSEVQMLSQRGDWVYASLPNNMRGWIPAASVELVRL